MGKTVLGIIFRSDELEIEEGVYGFVYSMINSIRADIRSKRYSFSDGQTITPQASLSISFSILLSNDKTDRVNRISHIVYKDNIYTVEGIEQFGPRVVITPGGKIAKSDLTQIFGEEFVDNGLNNATSRSTPRIG